ncbi:MAG: ferredoxin reductase [Nitriliruptorales bacterium]|nr:ferredoxin reductase [Nitriliruptorales bacterium]
MAVTTLSPRLRKALGNPFFEALAAPHGVSHWLEQVNLTWTIRSDRAIVTDVRHQTADAVTLTLAPVDDGKAQFLPGQYLQVGVEIEGVTHTRCFSISCAAGRADRRLEITVKRHDDGFVSSWLKAHAEPGLVLTISDPAGDFTLPSARPAHLVLVSGGSGITPVMSMLRTLVAEEHAGRVTFLHFARTADELIFADELALIDVDHDNVNVVTVFTREGGAHLSPAMLAELDIDPAAALAFACGPRDLVDAAIEIWSGAGNEDRLFVEYFQPPAVDLDADEASGAITFAASGITVENDGRTLLEQAEAAGLAPASGCRMGICHTCPRRKTSGTVLDAVTGTRSATADEEIRICVSVPCGDVELDL